MKWCFVLRFRFFVVVLALGWVAAGAARADVADELRALALRRDVPAPDIARQLESLRTRVATADAPVRHEFMRQEVEVMTELGQFLVASERVERLIVDAGKTNDETGRAQALVLKSKLAYYRGDPRTQRQSAELAVAAAKASRQSAVMAQAYLSLGAALDAATLYEDATRALETGLTEAQRSGSPELLAALYRELANLNIGLKDFQRALNYVSEAGRLAAERRQDWLLASIEVSKSIIFSETGRSQDDYASLLRANQLAHALGLVVTEQTSLINLSDWHLQREDWQAAANFARRAIALSERFDERVQEGTGHINLGLALVGAGKLAEGIEELETARTLYEQVGDRAHLTETLPDLARAYERAGRLRDALGAFKRYREVQVQLDQQVRTRLVAEMQERFDSERRQQQIERLQQENAIQSASVAHQRQLTWFWTLSSAALVLAIGVIALMFRRSRRANTQLAEANARLAYLAERDPLTGLFNRRAMQAWIDTLPVATPGLPLGLVLLDIDHFKAVNDRLGHAVGDQVIMEVGRRLAALLRDGDRLARWGGEEFLVVVQGIEAADLPGLAGRVLDAVAGRAFETGSRSIPGTVSIGYCPFPLASEASADGWEAHLGLADQALYLAKQSGRNHACGLIALNADWPSLRRACAENFEAVFYSDMVKSALRKGQSLDLAQVIPLAAAGAPARPRGAS